METNEELIAEARDMALYARTHRHGAVSHSDMLDRLADALEAATTEWGYKHAEMLGGTDYTYGDDDGKPFETWDAANSARIDESDYVVGRRKAGPWLPVEGENA